jgi:hypothetical protein
MTADTSGRTSPRFSLGCGDRFGYEGRAQLRAFVLARQQGIPVVPVWNKSHREHRLTGTRPADVRREADEAVAALGWSEPYYVDADHVTASTLADFVTDCDFFTLDVAEAIGRPPPPEAEARLRDRARTWLGRPLPLPYGDWRPTAAELDAAVRRQAAPIEAARAAWERLRALLGERSVHVEVSMDETSQPQSLADLWVILIGLADAGVPVHTLAPRFPGAFHKGVDYEGDPTQFGRRLEEALTLLRYAREELGIPAHARLSLHSGSDKFRLYPVIREVLHRTGEGLHVKTAGTTWLEEVVGLVRAGSEGAAIVREIYRRALDQAATLLAPYAAVVSVDVSRLPPAHELAAWSADHLAAAIVHDPSSPKYWPELRQFFHVAYPVAAAIPEFHEALRAYREFIEPGVTFNLLERHLRPLFG